LLGEQLPPQAETLRAFVIFSCVAYLLHLAVPEVVMYRLRSIALLSTLALAAPVVASAQSPWGGRTTNAAPAYNQGYTRGERAGTDDARHGDRYQYTDESDY